MGSPQELRCPTCSTEFLVRFKAVELTSWGTLRTLGMNGARKVPVPLNEWIHDDERGFTTAKGISGARFVADLARNWKKNPPYRTAIALILGHEILSENRWVTVFRKILAFTVIERTNDPSPRIRQILETA